MQRDLSRGVVNKQRNMTDNNIALFFNDEIRSVYIRVNRAHWTLEIELEIARTF